VRCSRSLTRWGKPHLPGYDERILTEYAESTVFADCDEQLFLLVGSYFIGTHILSFFGISLPVVQVGGGLIVISTGWALLKQGNDDEEKARRRKFSREDPFRNAFYPLTLPLTVGPGSISVAITLGANAPQPSRVQSLEHFDRNCRVCSARGQHFSLLRVCRPPGKDAWRDGDDRDHATYLVPARVHRRADPVERRQRAFGVASLAYALSEGSAGEISKQKTSRSGCGTPRTQRGDTSLVKGSSPKMRISRYYRRDIP